MGLDEASDPEILHVRRRRYRPGTESLAHLFYRRTRRGITVGQNSSVGVKLCIGFDGRITPCDIADE